MEVLTVRLGCQPPTRGENILDYIGVFSLGLESAATR